MTEQERQERMEKMFEKMLNMEMTNREMYEQCRNLAHEPMTNKEYYTETDEELAGFLSRTCRDLLASVVEDGGSVPNEYIEEDRVFWLKWLKEIHK